MAPKFATEMQAVMRPSSWGGQYRWRNAPWITLASTTPRASRALPATSAASIQPFPAIGISRENGAVAAVATSSPRAVPQRAVTRLAPAAPRIPPTLLEASSQPVAPSGTPS